MEDNHNQEQPKQEVPDTSPIDQAPAVNQNQTSQSDIDSPQPIAAPPESEQVVAPVSPPVSTEPVVSSDVHVSSPKKRHFRPEIIFPSALRNKLGSKAKPLALVLIAVVVILIGGGAYALTALNHNNQLTSSKNALPSTFKGSFTAFKLVSTDPSTNATGVNPDSSIVLNFNQPVTAAKLVNNMFLTPNVNGTYKQGSNPDQVIFQPSTPFDQGTSVAVMVNSTYASNSGQELGLPYEYKFTTSIPGNNVLFQDQNDLIDQVDSLASGQKATFSLLVGGSIGSGASLTLYKGSVSAMLSSLVYSSSSADQVNSVSVNGLQKISSINNITNNQSYTVQQPDGLYVVVASDSSGNQVGYVWVDFSDYGVLLRQDDQKIVADAQSFSNSSDVPAAVTFYNLNNSVTTLDQQTVNGLTTINLPFTPSVDLAVASYNNETAVVPIEIPNSGGDIRVDQNLSTAQAVYGVTDKPTYEIGQTIQFSGFALLDNDAQYVNPGSGSVSLYVSSYKGGPALATATASIDASGMFSGTFSPSSSWLDGQNINQLQIFVAATDGNSMNDLPLASFVVTNQSNSPDNITVQFAQSSYTPNQKIQAMITATDSNGKPLSNQTIQVHTFTEDYYLNDPAANLENFGYIGNELSDSPATVTLNSSGQATFTVSPSKLPSDGNSQLVTIQANLAGQSGGVGAAGGASTIINQGNVDLSFGLTRHSVPEGSSLVSDVYATDLSGTPLVSTNIKYSLVNSSSATVASGSVNTNSAGLAVITIPSSELAADSYSLNISTTDSSGNVVSASSYYGVVDSSAQAYNTSGADLLNLNVSGSSTDLTVGQTVNLTVNSPTSIRAMVTMDRGRIYDPMMVNLSPGNNNLSFEVPSDLAPSFTLTFNYFLNGLYQSEGVAFNVSESSQAASVSINAPTSAVTANKQLTVPVTVKDSSGNGIPASMIVDVVSANSYNLTSSVAPSIFNVLFNPRPIMTSSSSSLSPVGSGGGRCGGGGGDLPSFTNPVGTTLLWQPELKTNQSGTADVVFTPPAGKWVIDVYALGNSTQAGSDSATITAQ